MATPIIVGLHPWDRRLFLATCASLAMAADRLVRLGVPREETAPYFDVLGQLKARLQGGPVPVVHLLEVERYDGSGAWCRQNYSSDDEATFKPEECTCLTCLRAALTSRVHENPLGLTVTPKGDTIVS